MIFESILSALAQYHFRKNPIISIFNIHISKIQTHIRGLSYPLPLK